MGKQITKTVLLFFQAEELNTIIGNAFKMAYAKQKTQQPTFNELIEKQLAEQKAKFEEYQEQASRALQQRLNEIATPTALQRMEMRRQSSSDDLLSSPGSPPVSEREFIVGKNKVWVSHAWIKIILQNVEMKSKLVTFRVWKLSVNVNFSNLYSLEMETEEVEDSGEKSAHKIKRVVDIPDLWNTRICANMFVVLWHLTGVRTIVCRNLRLIPLTQWVMFF